MAIKKTQNISTVRTTPQTKNKLEQTVKALGFRSMAHFFTRSMETLLEQVEAGQRLLWPLRFEEQKEQRTLSKRKPGRGSPKKS